MKAAGKGNVEAVRALLEAGAEVNHQDKVSRVRCVCYVLSVCHVCVVYESVVCVVWY